MKNIYGNAMINLTKIILVASLASCSDADASREALENQGFTDIEITGYSPFSCGEDDTFSTGFTATNPQGRKVSGTVCCGLLKNCTVRW